MKVKKFKVNKSNVKKINKDMTNPNMITILAITAPWCGHCQTLKPEWKKVLKNTNNHNNLMLGMVEENLLNDIKCDTKIEGYPTIRVFKGGKKKKDYNGERDALSIQKFIKKIMNKYKGNKYSKIKKTKKLKSKKRKKSRKKTKKKSRNGLRHKFYKMIESKF